MTYTMMAQQVEGNHRELVCHPVQCLQTDDIHYDGTTSRGQSQRISVSSSTESTNR